jgi:hypothetical protein
MSKGSSSDRAASESNLVSRADSIDQAVALSPFKEIEWRALSPAERLERAWALRSRLVDPQDAHDRKLFPAP